MKYIIQGTNSDTGLSEPLDEADTLKEAELLSSDYAISFGRTWAITILEVGDEQ